MGFNLAEGKLKPRLLIVEDDQENQKFLRVFLRKIYELDFCDSAESFYSMLKENTYNIILMDISLRGDKDGFQLTKELRNNPKFQNIPIVGLSAHAFQKDKENAYNAGVDIFITKPVYGHILIESLASVLKKRQGSN